MVPVPIARSGLEVPTPGGEGRRATVGRCGRGLYAVHHAGLPRRLAGKSGRPTSVDQCEPDACRQVAAGTVAGSSGLACATHECAAAPGMGTVSKYAPLAQHGWLAGAPDLDHSWH